MPRVKRAPEDVPLPLLDLLVEGYRSWSGRRVGAGWLEWILSVGDAELAGTYHRHKTAVDEEAQRRGLRASWAERRLRQLAKERRYREQHGIPE